ncbi:hypothetical protein EDI_187090 [Entamoeba dispar SAW760]|uniref:Myb/SANT-like DNA-binding domain-containing protein n=1 Tax=Entamoeba dispar (strain ATCC PRA-260 / SAW760) TaxID=370354 RepID=B0ENA4_ENTDS|nr:uncharacterized protein EDI_187090 [Entamoeba dispar SAW760]EDR23981.1 hypothetical protein EDI_187090 [Entamoeba dispar SAW760]|eukprot:EDR23981.1 hypothetical protein EDI_187090 [Entamoeba dispar SAW760]
MTTLFVSSCFKSKFILTNSSVFTPVKKSLYCIIWDTTVSNSTESDLIKEVPRSSRDWSDLATLYIILKYRKWQLKDRRTQPLKQFHIQCSNDLMNDLGIKKTSTQLRDKINNTRSSYHAISKQRKEGIFDPIQTFLNKRVLKMMKFLYDTKSTVTVEDIDVQINTIIKQNSKIQGKLYQ